MAAKLFDTVFSFQNLILAAVVESVVLTKLLPDHVPLDNPLVRMLAIAVLANIGVYCLFWGIVYPYTLSPIRHFPTIDVRLP